MAIDPREDVRQSGMRGEDKLRAKLRELERQVEDLKRSRRVFVTSGAPTVNAPAGTLAVDPTAHRLWVSEGGGNWKSVVVA